MMMERRDSLQVGRGRSFLRNYLGKRQTHFTSDMAFLVDGHDELAQVFPYDIYTRQDVLGTVGTAAAAVISSIFNTECLVVDTVSCCYDHQRERYLLGGDNTFPRSKTEL